MSGKTADYFSPNCWRSADGRRKFTNSSAPVSYTHLGKLPFEAENAVSVAIMQMQSEAKPPRSINPEIPEGLEEITLKAMKKDPEQRYALSLIQIGC